MNHYSFGTKIYVSYSIGDHENMTSWNQIMAALENVDFVDVILIIGFLYIVASYYTRNFGENDDVPAKNRSDASTDESSFARGDGWQRDSIGLHSGKPGGNNIFASLIILIYTYGISRRPGKCYRFLSPFDILTFFAF